METNDVVNALAALAQPIRLQVFRALVVAGPEGLTPGVIAERLGLAAPTLSFHLKELMHAELVTQQRSSRHLIYRAAYPRMSALVAYLSDNCCGGQPCGVADDASHHLAGVATACAADGAACDGGSGSGQRRSAA